MNFLAHVYLARHSDDAMLGALLGDFVGTAGIDLFKPEVQREILLHRKIDSYTDQHPAVQAMRALFPDGRRRYAGILLDVYFDHLLARDWAQYSDVPLDVFSRHFYDVLMAHLPVLPARLQAIAPRIVEHDWFGMYRRRENVDAAVTRIATRLSRNGDKLVACLPILRAHEAEVASGFQPFFRDLVAYSAQARTVLEANAAPA
ncbi:ACP phosphodiesterase [Arenimonas sp. MALMAid1274]|uniref:acyl carrier protein phosphodiesterase n=1 Tax=Arenimonas sp. MALMAid1274 TaxID=3411630 RepID=UPI003BA05549